MSDPFIGQIRMFAGSFAPVGWAFCDGSVLNVSANPALFSILGSIYGGDGRTTFGLPDLRGRVPVHEGSGLGLTARALGAKGGSETVTLTANQIPSHNHTVAAVSSNGNQGSPVGNLPGAEAVANHDVWSDADADGTMKSTMIGNTGGGQSHNNLQPFQVINYIIALVGTMPTQT